MNSFRINIVTFLSVFCAFYSVLILSVNDANAQTTCPPMSEECLATLLQRESSGDWQIISQDGYLGAFQFGEMAMVDVGFYTPDGTNEGCARSAGGCDWVGQWTGFMGVNSRDDYLNNPEAQLYAVNRLAELNVQRHMSSLAPYIGQTINGVPITCEGLMMGMHLRGFGTSANPGVGAFLSSGGATDNTDANGTPVSEYINMGNECSGTITIPPQEEAFESCDQEILSTGSQLGQARMEIEKRMIDEALPRPASVMELSCFDQFGEMFNQEIGSIFGNTGGDDIPGEGLSAWGFDDIFRDAQGRIGQEILFAATDGLLGTRGNTINNMISTQVQGMFDSLLGGIGGGGGGNVNFQCEAMNVFWDLLQCEDIFDFQIPTLDDIFGDLNLRNVLEDALPESCAGQILGNYAISSAPRIFSAFNE